ncbi:fructokinase/branched chain amino acid--2-keto-4-methylthiobutyrate aminotransferase [Carnobacterium maltaromaticum]|nr:fructokinase/branched chain amino acid--2-keto-4-methylthiobutyrate aminotransferase [Carnobacterium maltaromaticum]PLS35507.1 fructokinase/branched chain amino acid--2-keto-4-methylthiobutyrate aminotransferase [Carnobacterium maltaromaticum]PLS35957.1 fructokinase/branched chain amino acid--2-keto-4-methylthiobutyrate aminotransferase [Carnobacterium maltaromaticum]PLS42415.1 fructokinase/branched chain amino acid--2-keto-4-methylthiobutyrate aminotransferase [Carnobacterium maltaromaticum]
MQLYGSIEGGGTKFVCAIGNEQLEIVEKVVFKTTTPEETLKKVVQFFEEKCVSAIGMGMFGPLEQRVNHERYGYITSTPKQGWANVYVVSQLKEVLNVPIYFTTDVNSSAYGEFISRGAVSGLVYYTIGTGIGAGIVLNGEIIGVTGHPEMGHVSVKRRLDDADFEGVCPYHKDCLEGLASGPNLQARLGILGERVALDHPVFELIGYYIAQACVQATLTLRPNVIVLGGGVMSSNLLEIVKKEFKKTLNNYIEIENIDTYLSLPIVVENGLATIGNFALAKKRI